MDVSILMPVYNREKFIDMAIESALAQQTEFSYEILIADNCSTDGTEQVVRSYVEKHPDKIKYFRHEQNGGLMRNYKFLLEHAQGKYAAFLESDDMWTNPKKLQLQISFLEQNPEYGLCCGDYSEIDENNIKIRDLKKNFDGGLDGNWYDSLLLSNHIGAVTIVFRKSIYDSYCNMGDYLALNFKTLDYPVLLSVCSHSKGKYIHENLASYRIWTSSISNSSDYEKRIEFQDSVFDIQNYIIKKYGLGSLSYDEIVEISVINHLRLAIRFKKLKEFIKFSRQLKSKKLKFKLLHWFPRLWYLQHQLRIGNN